MLQKKRTFFWPATYLLRIRTVSGPYLVQTYRYGENTD